MLPSCFSCFGSGLLPSEHFECSREELKQVYDKSISLNNGRLIVSGIFARADTRNNNKRVYPKRILKREVAKFEAEHIKKGTALGELDHPNYQSRYFKCLNLPNVSHQVLDVRWKKDQLWGTIEILPTPSGLLLWELYSQGIRLGVSSRGWASLRADPKQKCIVVEEDFELITFDFVTEPSTKGAFLTPLRKPYRCNIPNQSRYVHIAHLGYGVVSMKNITKLPDPSVLVLRVGELKHMHQVQPDANFLSAPSTAATTGGPVAAKGIDKLLLYSHYIVHQEDSFLDREANFRDYRAHLAMFATRAHLADQQIGKIDINAVILQELAKDNPAVPGKPAHTDASENSSSGSTLGNTSCKDVEGLGCKTTLNPEPTSESPNDLESWYMHPNAMCLTPRTPPIAESSRRGPPTPNSEEAGAIPQAVATLCPNIKRPEGQDSSRNSFVTSSDITVAGQHKQTPRLSPSGSQSIPPQPAAALRTVPVDMKLKAAKPSSATGKATFASGPPNTQPTSSAAMAAAAAVGPGVDVSQVVAEFDKIKKTLAAFADKYQQYQGQVHTQVFKVKTFNSNKWRASVDSGKQKNTPNAQAIPVRSS